MKANARVVIAQNMAPQSSRILQRRLTPAERCIAWMKGLKLSAFICSTLLCMVATRGPPCEWAQPSTGPPCLQTPSHSVTRHLSGERVTEDVSLASLPMRFTSELSHGHWSSFAWPHWSILSGKFWQCGVRWFLSILAGALLGLLLIPAFFLVLALLGFTAGGVAAGSLAACCQAQLGVVAAGSCFSVAQSIGALGMTAACTPPVLMTTSLTGAAVATYLVYLLHCPWFSAVCCHDDWQWWTNATSAL